MPANQPIDFNLPTPETLGGIYIRVEEKEDVSIIPGQIPPLQLPLPAESNGQRVAERDRSINILVQGTETTITEQPEPTE